MSPMAGDPGAGVLAFHADDGLGLGPAIECHAEWGKGFYHHAAPPLQATMVLFHLFRRGMRDVLMSDPVGR